ncbi:MAG: OPT/YSL family transporter [Myxococcales bacterium]|nr:OPT/YSL family transporter [Myxococcales bacterium]
MHIESAETAAAGKQTVPDGVDPEAHWFKTVYQGDTMPQFTLRSFVMGSVIGVVMAASNLYVGLKTGWGLGVAITACILSFALGRGLQAIGLFKSNLSILENNAMASTASSAGYSTGGTMVSAMCAYLLVKGSHMPWPLLVAWTFLLAVLGTVMAIPMKRQMINVEQLQFPSGTAAAETLRSLYSAGEESAKKARALFAAMGVGAVVAWLRDAHAVNKAGVLGILTKLSKIPATFGIPKLTIAGQPALTWTIGFEGSLIMVAAGAMMGLRTTASMLAAALLNYGYLAPKIHAMGGITRISYRGIVSWSLWPGAALMVTSGLLTFALQWRTILRAFSGFGGRKTKAGEGAPYREGSEITEKDQMAAIEVPNSWFGAGMLFATIGLVIVGWLGFGIAPWLSIIAVLLSFVLAIVACRATGETDTTPVGAMGKITQLTYGVLAPANVTTNLLTASITAGAAGSAADLLTDLKSGYLLGANPRRQFLAQFSGTFVGTLVIVPLFYVLVPTPAALGGDRFPAPAAQVWKGVAEALSHGVHSLHPTARWGMLIGGIIGIVLPLLELAFPKHKKYLPSAMGVGLALVIPAWNSVSMFIGALLAYAFSRYNEKKAETYTIPVASGIIAGESLLGVIIALMSVAHLLE